ncbi:uncharacterized protein LOC100841103 [Brachypodium distachyon]|uniref:Uncharacterized protein n=1 Tax=Brachypodium distachyon TaxID=15368 RepID=I1GL55_BRADI|nr:uncharacterized protein LOC100841103 [Brachypodium distachyon]XP_010238257.1 uncharacterized protein LOC100841103 [Brachypodium distachyon]KQK12267.1 hypothetical protein BRADI_1g02540v3 [Brachypodium distachyon]|eukprot:XP_003562912.1 uncharacterized protein LOC100841103 [Brachypodium distachyon]
MNSRPVVLIFLLLVLIVTSQFEWKQQIGEAEATPAAATRRRQQALVVREDAIKEKIILAQEKNIQQLTELIQSLQVQLLHCRGSNSTTAHSASSNQSLTKDSKVEGPDMMDD